jgi:co-chaperonin GroES (HSP10)
MIQPLRDRILVRPIERTKSDILAVIMQENPNMGEVVAVGPGSTTRRVVESRIRAKLGRR